MEKICVCFLLLVSNSLFGQVNLVPNPSFEDTVSCPNLSGQISFAEGWYSSRGTPDYFNNCSSNFGFSNNFGYQVAHSGYGYAGFIAYQRSASNYREHVAIELLNPLQIGQKYYLTFYISRADFNFVSIATNKLGILLSTVKYIYPTYESPVSNSCNFYSDSVVNDYNNWTVIKGNFIADSAYTFINIGNFYDDANSDTILNNPSSSAFAYYYIDDICVSTDSNYCATWTAIENMNSLSNEISIYPNPASDFIAISFDKSQDAELRLVDLLGNTILTTEVINKKECSINVSAVAAGCYFLQIVNKRTGTTTTKKIMII